MHLIRCSKPSFCRSVLKRQCPGLVSKSCRKPPPLSFIPIFQRTPQLTQNTHYWLVAHMSSPVIEILLTQGWLHHALCIKCSTASVVGPDKLGHCSAFSLMVMVDNRSEEHTSELQSRENLVCRLLLEKKKKQIKTEHRQYSISTRYWIL